MTREIRGLLLALAACCLFGSFILLASGALSQKPRAAAPPEAAPKIEPAKPLPPAAAQGRELFMQSCAECHAADASGDEGPDLRHLVISDAHIALVVSSGIKGEMPSFQKKYGPTEIAALQAYLGSLR
jgi:mono/diheme cytochrome c family protein